MGTPALRQDSAGVGRELRFYLGTHRPYWLGQVDVPLFVSRATLRDRVSLPTASAPWALDSGGFTEVTARGGWSLSAEEYAEEVRHYSKIGMLQWASPQDWMCEAVALASTGLTIAEHQARTVDNLLELRDIAPDIPWIPVLQGWTLREYIGCVQRYERTGVDLTAEPLVGLGTVCRRQHTTETEKIVTVLQNIGIRMHGFGVKVSGLKKYGHLLESADSMAWSYGARVAAARSTGPRENEPPRSTGCEHRVCNNCQRWALQWRQQVLETL